MRFSIAHRSGLALLLALTTACADSTASQRGSLSILLTDAPGDLVKAVVTIDQIYLQGSPDEGSGGRIILREDDVTVDLLTLANSTAELVQDAVVPAGTYAQLRFVISGGYIEVEQGDGSTRIYASSPTYEGLPADATVDGALQMPSFAQTGIKVNLPGGSVQIAGEQKILLVDFDVSRSYGQVAGQSGMWVMHPVLDATDFSTSSSVLVTLAKAQDLVMPTVNGSALGLGSFSAVMINGEDGEESIDLTDADGDGAFEAQFRYLIPGPYTLEIRNAEAGVTFTTDPVVPKEITVGPSSATTHAFILTSASN